MRRTSLWSWLWFAIGAVYFAVPLIATLQFSLQAKKGELGLTAYERVLQDPKFLGSFSFSFQTALATIVVCALLIVPTAYWVQLRMPRLRPVVEFITLLPFVVPAVVLVFGLARTYVRTPLTDSRQGLWVLLVGSYVVLALPYMYRAVDTGLRAINVRALTEAAQSLGAGWGTILARVIFPNISLALASGAFVTFAIVMGEFTIASLLAQPAFGPYMNLLSSSKVYEPSALAVVSFGLTWASIALIQVLGRGSQRQVGGVR
jgi:putative spermidine/putrescine transport system permease protein